MNAETGSRIAPSPSRTRSRARDAATAAGLTAVTESALSLREVGLSYPDAEILRGINIDVRRGEILGIIGPSGCGKSTILNLTAGLLHPTTGDITCFGEPVRGVNHRVTYMTQKDTLLPWRRGIDNVALPLEVKGVGKRERRDRARAAMARVGVSDAANRKPHQLSGGMRARVSLARALMSDTDILLMDEPFAAVDALRRVRLQQLLIELWEETKKTILYVTHDLNEAITLGHRVIVMSSGLGTVHLEKAISAPQPRDVARFHTTQIAQDLYAELWDDLEGQFQQ